MPRVITTKKTPSDTLFLTGMRGYAAFWVFLIHLGGFLSAKHWILKSIISQGGLGVIIFFVLSAFCITLSIYNDKRFTYFGYIGKRIFRIAPLYYLVVLIGFAFGGELYYKNFYHVAPYSLFDLFYHLSFLNLFNSIYIHTLVGFAWNIPIEVFYYLLLPMAFFLSKKHRFFIGIIAVAGVFLFFNPQVHLPFYKNYQADYSMERYLIFYAVGLFVFFEIYYKKINRIYILNLFIILIASCMIYLLIDIHDKIFFLILVLLCCYYLFSNFLMRWLGLKSKIKTKIVNISGWFPFLFLAIYLLSNPTSTQLIVGCWAGVLILSCMNRNIISKSILENKLAIYMGERSYSFYLIHALFATYIFQFKLFENNPAIRFFVVLIVTIVVSAITYKFIERPFIRKGKNIAFHIYKRLSHERI